MRLKGYTDALLHSKIKLNEKLIIDCDKDEAENHQLIKKGVTKQKPDGILSSIEKLGVACYHVCNELKLQIPQQIKIVSFSNLETASLLRPSLTTVTQPAFEIGRQAAHTLFQMLENKKVTPESKMIPSILIERESTAL